MGKLKITDKQSLEICKKYTEDSISILNIAKIFNVSGGCILKHLHKHDITIKTKKIKFNQNYFNIIDTPAKAQILGFIYADGCVESKRPVFKLTLAEQDYEYLDNIINII